MVVEYINEGEVDNDISRNGGKGIMDKKEGREIRI